TYTKAKPVQERQLEELIRPDSIVFHYGENKHTRAYANNDWYRYMIKEMSKWYFYDFSYHSLTKTEWEELTQNRIGLEILYRDSVPISIINKLFTFRGEMYDQLKRIDRLWLYYDKENDVVFALFISQKDKQVVRARTVVSAKDLQESYLPVGKRLPEQILKVVADMRAEKDIPIYERPNPFWQIYYLPKDRLAMRQYRFNSLPITENELMEAFFLDPALVRQIVERDGTTIYTDGTRAIQMGPNAQAITFTDPGFQQTKNEMTDEDKVRAGISFINQHLGWTDDYLFEKIEEGDGQGDEITFRLYVGAYPLVSMNREQNDSIRMTLEDGQVVTMKRSLIDLDKFIDYQEMTVMSGSELFEYLRVKGIDTKRIKSAYLAYQTKLFQGYVVELNPVWVVTTVDDREYVFSARSISGGKEHGLE
ncbi:MAG: YycH family regulatory protein, partial [Clostridia bacterium]